MLVIVGDGPSRRRWQATSGAGVIFTGELRGAALAEAYASSDVFALAADEETFGNVVLEAMASGVPVIVSSRGAARELVRDSTGLVVDMQRRGALAAALAALLRDDARRSTLAQGARREAQRRSWEAATAQLLHAYASAPNENESTLIRRTKVRRGARRVHDD